MIPRRISIFATVLLLALGMNLWARPYMVLFGSSDCDSCAEIKAMWMERPCEDGCPVLVYVSIDDDRNYAYLKRIERTLALRKSSSTFPLILVGGEMVSGLDGFYSVAARLNSLLDSMPEHPVLAPLRRCAENAEGLYAEWNAGDTQESPAPVASAPTAQLQGRLLYLSTPGCQKCARQQRELTALVGKHPGITVDHYEVTGEDGMIMRNRMIEKFNIQGDADSLVPAVAWDAGYITGRLAEAEELAAALAATTTAEEFWRKPIQEAERVKIHGKWQQLLDNTTWVAMLSAGAMDGINPCAFATVIFLISYLLYLKRGKRYVLAVGLCFCAGVFAAYLLFGLGLSFLVKYLAGYDLLKQIVYGIMTLVTLILAALHLRDAIRYKRSGKVSDMDMGLNAGTHRKIHDKIHRWSEISGWLAIPAALLLGLVVSSLELACTGQIYLPVIVALNASGFDLKAFLWLLLYNVAFIAPLVAVTLLAYFGVGVNSVAKWAKNHVFATKIAMSIVFVLLAALMVMLIFLL